MRHILWLDFSTRWKDIEMTSKILCWFARTLAETDRYAADMQQCVTMNDG